MSTEKFHIGKNGPAICNARKIACRLGGTERHGTRDEMISLWEQEQEAALGDSMLSGVSRAVDEKDPSILSAKQTLGNRSNYKPAHSQTRWSESERAIAMKLALSNLSELSYVPIDHRDNGWSTDGCSVVERYVLKDGSVGYFKSFYENSYEEGVFEDYGCTALGASINEVNTYRMAKLLGKGYDELVPETVLREVDGSLGTLQREVKEDARVSRDLHKSKALQEDYRRAAVLDFVIGNLDRHSDNFLYGIEVGPRGKRSRIRLIDNSFTFATGESHHSINESLFAENSSLGGYYDRTGYTVPEVDKKLTADEVEALKRARAGVEEWISSKTIAHRRGKDTIKRIDYLLKEGRLSSFSEYADGLL